MVRGDASTRLVRSSLTFCLEISSGRLDFGFIPLRHEGAIAKGREHTHTVASARHAPHLFQDVL